MRFKEIDQNRSIAVHNGNHPLNGGDLTTTGLTEEVLNNPQWSSYTDICNTNQRDLLQNINNNLASNLQEQQRNAPTTILPRRNVITSSLCSESSPDDSLLEYEDAHQSGSSVDASPQGDEDRCFELSDTESLSDDGNISTHSTLNKHHVHSRGIINPNYPGFQHLAHTLDYVIKTHNTQASDTDCTDDDLDADPIVITKTETNINIANNNNNNNNNNDEDVLFKIDSVNRLDSVENIQKVFYDKPKFNIEPLECEIEKCSNVQSQNTSDNLAEIESTGATAIDDGAHSEIEPCQADVPKNLSKSESSDDIIGDFGKEIEQEIGRIVSRSIEFEKLERAVEKLSVAKNREPAAARYNIEPNDNEPFEKFEVETKKYSNEEFDEIINKTNTLDELLELVDSDTRGDNKMLTMLKTTEPKSKLIDEPIKMDTSFIQDSNRDVQLDDSGVNRSKENLKDVIFPKNDDDTTEKFCKEDITKNDKEKDEDSVVPRKKEKMEINYTVKKNRRDLNQQVASIAPMPRRDMMMIARHRDIISSRRILSTTTTPSSIRGSGISNSNCGITKATRATHDLPYMKKRNAAQNHQVFGGFDVYNIETAMPKIDMDAIELHLRAAREEERRRRTDREEIRRRLAMGSESDDYYTPGDRPGRKPSLQARLQSGMNLQICFMNETVSDSDSPNSDTETSSAISTPAHQTTTNGSHSLPYTSKLSSMGASKRLPKPNINQNGQRPQSLPLNQTTDMSNNLQALSEPMTEANFFARQARLQIEARMALAQAKEMAHMQMEVERQKQKKSPITEMVRSSLEKVGIQFPEERRRVSRQILTEMNIAQLQVIVNDLHTQIESLNEGLVRFLMERDDLHMEQDSMLVDIEDLTRYLGAKEQTIKDQQTKLVTPQVNNNNSPPSSLTAISSSVKPRLHRIASLVKK